jgi:transcriptional antiterminator NusG
MGRIFQLGDMVRIRTGPFASFTGRIKGINQAKALVKVKVDIFGRDTDVRLSFDEVEVLEFDPRKPPPYGSDN